MSEGHFTRSQVSANRCLRQGADSARDSIRDIFKSAALANGSYYAQQTEKDLYDKLEAYGATLPCILKPSLMDIDVCGESFVGWANDTKVYHSNFPPYYYKGCRDVMLRLSYYPYTTHESHETAAFRIEYVFQLYDDAEKVERLSANDLKLLRLCHQPRRFVFEPLPDCISVECTLVSFNTDLALWMAIEILIQVRDTQQYICRTNYTDVFLNVDDEVERLNGFWGELKDDIYHHLVIEKNTYFDSRDIGLLI